ncbi:hypothetical protein O181_000644 [Austropuccinia psidii MF-1]|uniref:Uncharacterized protein n=1 Tax=Austropuccinia psidii MF-1 TaxID=1389203 RepID=A0A9Q3GB41_9BASI|nr:hypothetical protein [Austropuccinia psidii MF-1]
MKLNQVIFDNTRKTGLWQEIPIKKEMYKIELINPIKGKMNFIEELLHTIPRMSKDLNQNEVTGNSNPQVLDVENSQLKNEFSTFFHNLEPSMGQEWLKEMPRLKEWPHFSGEGEYGHMKFIRGIEMIKEEFELPERFETLFTKSAHRWYIKLRQAHGYQSWTWWKNQTIYR